MRLLQPWEMSFNGRTWREMPGVGEDNKKLNFFLYRSGMLDVEDETTCETLAADGIMEVVTLGDTAPKKAKLVSRWIKRFGGHGRKPKRVREEPVFATSGRPKVLTEADLQWRMQLRLKLGEIRQGHLHAISTIAAKAEVNYLTLATFIREGRSLCTAALQRCEKVALDYEAGLVPLRGVRRGKVKGFRVSAPEGCIPFRDWLVIEAAKRSVKPHTLRAYYLRHKDQLPELVKVNRKCFFVRVQEVAA